MSYDILILGGTIYDGSGKAPVVADVAIADGRIAEIGRITGEAKQVVDAKDLAVAPGFIDIHSHSDYTLLIDPRAMSAVVQGVTLEVIGNCGFGCAPIADTRLAANAIYGFDNSIPLTWQGIGGYLEKLEAARPAINVMTLMPNGQLRLATLGLKERAANQSEIAHMRGLLRDGLSEGAAGYSIGLEYPSEAGSSEEELTALARETGRAGKIFATHTRDRQDHAAEAVEEVIRIARNAEVQLQVSHLIPRCDHRGSLRCVEVVDEARAKGQDIAFDMHTRLYGTTMLSTLLPPWALTEGSAGVRKHLADEDSRAHIKAYPSLIGSVGNWDNVILLDLPGRADVSRLSLGEIGRRQGRDPYDCALDILSDEAETLQRPMVLLTVYDEAMQKVAFAHPLCMPGSDATTLATDGPLADKMFHGAYTWAAWFWRALVREWRLLKPEEAVHRLTGMPAKILGLSDRGAIRVGALADIAVFSEDKFGERGTMFEPNQLAHGMHHVVVNGVATLSNGVLTGARAGQVLRKR
jgi:N-acyl-D-aspartate/D-glutamate deacylase